MPKTAFEAARKWFEAVILASCRLLMKTLYSREPDKLRIFVNYALKTPEYECLSNFNRITYCCHFSAYARGFVLFRTYESRSGDAEFGR